MNDRTIDAVLIELENELAGRRFGKVFPLSRRSFAVDFHLPGSRYLFIAAEPSSPRIYLIRRRLKQLERSSTPQQSFHLLIKKYLSGAEFISITRPVGERAMAFRFRRLDELGTARVALLVVQLTGRSSNVFLLDESERILGSLVEKDVDGQRYGEVFSIPPRAAAPGRGKVEEQVMEADANGYLSDALDRYYLDREHEAKFRSQADSERRRLERETSKKLTLLSRLRSDLAGHGDAQRWKRFGDLLLANLSTARRNGGSVIVVDYFDPSAPEIEIEIDENTSLTDAAQGYFKRYSKAQNAAVAIEKRIALTESEIEDLAARRKELEEAVERGDASFFEVGVPVPGRERERNKKERYPGARRFTSSDGCEILVGKRAADNDHLTFRIAASNDTWLHAADYPGSHVIIRNPNRREIPHRTLLEAAQLAAFYSSGKKQPKAAVHYTLKKFVNKPRGAAPGLVRLASFKTLMVEPSIPEAVDQKR